MPYLIAVLLLLALLYAPQLWARATFRRHARERADIPGSGGELARHLLDRFGMPQVRVERVQPGEDHYDPATRAVRLGTDNFDGRSLTAVAVAAHEVGHALQDQRNEPLLKLRTRLIGIARRLQQLGSLAMLVLPLLALLSRSPVLAGLILLLGIAGMLATALVHLVTLPVEMDASFGKALPILKQGNYIGEKDEAAVRRILKAAAWTYVAAALANLLNVGRWLRGLRRG